MGISTHDDNKPSVSDDYGPFLWWSAEILRTELRSGKTRADLAREWDTTWSTINGAIERHGLANELEVRA